MKKNTPVIFGIMFLLLISPAYSFKSSTEKPVHQHIAKESKEVWELIPYEMEKNINNSIATDDAFAKRNYETGDDTIEGSGEEDVPVTRAFQHFWNPDNPQSGDYNAGLNIWGSNRQSSYGRALEYWTEKVIPLYLRGDIEESYYWLGRVDHLLEDVAVTEHIHLDCHIGNPGINWVAACGGSFGDAGADDSSLEEYTGESFGNYSGSDYFGEQYYYEDLPNMGSFDWSNVEPEVDDYLFRLFWYTAQKTQYYASDDVDGNSVYYDLSDVQHSFSPSLWTGDGVTIINQTDWLEEDDETNSGDNITAVADAVVPHAMRATAGLYRLFWDTVHSYEWPTFHHDNQRTGFTILKGDIGGASDVRRNSIVLKGTTNEDFTRSSAADIDGDGIIDVVSVVAESGDHDLKIFGTESYRRPWSGEIKTYQRWVYPETGSYTGELHAPPTIGNIDTDFNDEVIFGLLNGTMVALNIDDNTVTLKWQNITPEAYSTYGAGNYQGELSFTAIEDVNNDGKNELIFSDGLQSLYDWEGGIYVWVDEGNHAEQIDRETVGNGGAFGAPSVADIDGDSKQEIIVPTFYGVRTYNFDSNQLSAYTNWSSNSDGKINGAVVVYDIDKDNTYEFIYTTTTAGCHASKTCYDRLYIRDSQTGANEGGSPISINGKPLVTPAIGDMDDDGDKEIIINAQRASSSQYGNVFCYEYNGNNCSGNWPWNNSATFKYEEVSPDVADIDGDGNYEVIIVEKNSSKIYVLTGTGIIDYTFNVYGEVGSAPAIADIDGDGKAEIVVKRGGSPVAIATFVSAENDKPNFQNRLRNLTGIAGEVIDVNSSGRVNVEDVDYDSLNVSYSSSFNSSGGWQTGVNDTGNYTIFVEVSDGNLSDYQELEVIIFNSTVNRVDSFANGSNNSLLSFSGSENQTVQVRLPKGATVVYARVDVEGRQT